MAKEKVLITGGAGYLGSVLTGHLLNEGYRQFKESGISYEELGKKPYANV